MARQEDEIPSNLSLSKSLGMMLERDLATDITFKIGDEKVEMKAHKMILMGRSPVFRAMFSGPLAEKTDVTIPDTDQHSFSVFLRYMKIKFTFDQFKMVKKLIDTWSHPLSTCICSTF